MIDIDVTVRMGGVFVSDRPAVIRTVLGSCIAVCLYDPMVQVGGMNHYMLPADDNVLANGTWGADSTRYGLHAMEVLMGNMQRAGARRERVLAKLFGGAHVLSTEASGVGVPARNIEFVQQYVREERLQVVAQDLGGYLPRRVHFYTHTGKVLIKRLGDGALRELAVEERAATQRRRASEPAPDITLFDE